MPTVELAECVATNAEMVHRGAYRPDIDGLRAVAILAVVAFHAGLRTFHGGFVGVDIFFVVSGFLIGGIVYREAKSQTFTFARFYKRRAKRILPAFFVVLLACYAVAVSVLSPSELRQFAGTALAALFSLSNVQLWLTTGYFTTGAQFNPLLMTWSLGVEEQFYILLPIALLLVISRKGHLATHAIALCTLISFALSSWGVAYHPTMSFFLLPTRAWEIGVGVLLAIYAHEQHTSSLTSKTRSVHILGGLGAVALIYSILVCRSTQFPGIAALVPVVGTLLLIASPNSFVSDVLSARPMIFVGKISYSWYLWHWPLLSFAKIICDRPLGQDATLSIVFVSFCVAIGSFYFVEQPFRHSSTPTRQMLIRYGTLLILISVPPLALIATKGLSQRRVQLAQMEAQGTSVTRDVCLAAYGKTTPLLTPECVSSANNGHIVALIGDSHAGTLATDLRFIAIRSGYAFEEIGKSSCPPLHKVTIYMPNHPGHDHECAEFNLNTLSYLRNDPRVEVVVIAGFWSAPFSQREEDFRYVPVTKRMDLSRYLPIPHNSGVPDEASRKYLEYGLESEVEQLRTAGKRVLIIKDAPQFTFNPVRYTISRYIPIRRNLEKLLSPGPKLIEYASGRAPVYDDFQESAVIDEIAARHSNVQVYDLREKLCDSRGCTFFSDDKLLYIDPNHLSQVGAEKALAGLDLDSARIEQ
jgi:peptidoglycan/LPS O-acetylase OafA/YrhL